MADSTFVDKNAAYEEFKVLFADDEKSLKAITADARPPSFRLRVGVLPRQCC